MKLFHQLYSSDLSLPPETFIFSLRLLHPSTPSTPHLTFASISSDDTLTYFRLHPGQPNLPQTADSFIKVHHAVKNAHAGISCLEIADKYRVATAGRDGFIKLWDRLTAEKQTEFKTPNGQAVSALACCAERNMLVVGTELEGNGPGDVTVYIWDVSTPGPQPPVRVYTDSHNDTITKLMLHYPPPPVPPTPHLISASTDGLINIFNPIFPDEEDAVLVVFNNKAAVQHVCPFVIEDGTPTRLALCAISHDERLAVYEVDDDEQDEGALQWPVLDVREAFKCDYAISLLPQALAIGSGSSLVLAVGGYRSETLAKNPGTTAPFVDLYTGTPQSPITSSISTPCSGFELALRLEGAHGDEVVRDIWYDVDSPVVLTCGEDGLVRIWQETGAVLSGGPDNSKAERRSKKEKRKSKGNGEGRARFKPY